MTLHIEVVGLKKAWELEVRVQNLGHLLRLVLAELIGFDSNPQEDHLRCEAAGLS